jgi:hypothetical protein
MKKCTQKNLPEKYKVLADSIRVGKSNAILLDDLMIIARIEDKRQAYTIIERLINRYGYVIGGSKQGKKGYYYPASEKEFNEIVNLSSKHLNSLQKKHDNLLINYKKKENVK